MQTMSDEKPLVLVLWRDACFVRDDWNEDDGERSLAIIQTVGWMVSHNNNAVVLTNEIVSHEEFEQYRGAIAIPTECVEEIIELEHKK